MFCAHSSNWDTGHRQSCQTGRETCYLDQIFLLDPPEWVLWYHFFSFTVRRNLT